MSLNGLSNIFFESQNKKSGLPVYSVGKTGKDLLDIIQNEREVIDNIILKYGGIIFRDFDIHSLSEFSKISNVFCNKLLDYKNRSTPRTELGKNVYTATEYPADRHIPFHNENSYTLKWPKKLLFFCVVPPESGGETPIADSRDVYKQLDPAVIKKFEDKKVMYKRNFISGIDLSWQEVFQTDSKEDVEAFCEENNIQYEWKNSQVELTTKEICQASVKHDVTNEKVWFNQAHLFHVSSLGNEDRDTLVERFGYKNLPRNAFYGDGSEIETEYLGEIHSVYQQNKIEFQWHKKDVMIIDNLLMAHSRNTFKGFRKIAVSMGD